MPNPKTEIEQFIDNVMLSTYNGVPDMTVLEYGTLRKVFTAALYEEFAHLFKIENTQTPTAMNQLKNK